MITSGFSDLAFTIGDSLSSVDSTPYIAILHIPNLYVIFGYEISTKDIEKTPRSPKKRAERHPEKMTQKIFNSVVHKSTSTDRPYKVGPNQL